MHARESYNTQDLKLIFLQRTYADDDIKTADRYKEGKENSHLANDSKDERTIANKLAREEQVRVTGFPKLRCLYTDISGSAERSKIRRTLSNSD